MEDVHGELERFRPFSDSPWEGDQKKAVNLLWEWRQQLLGVEAPAARENPMAFFEREAERIRQRKPLSFGDERLSRHLLESCKALTLPVDWLAQQVLAAHHFYGPIRFADATELKTFLGDWAAPLGYLLAKLAGTAHSWQLKQVDELAAAFFLVDHLVHLPDDLQKNRLFIPLTDLKQAGVSFEQLQKGVVTAAVRKLLWKQAIRIRDAFAQGQPLVNELPRRFRRPFKRYWLTGLELLNEVERRKYDVWSRPITLSAIHRFQVTVLSFIGKGAGKARGG